MAHITLISLPESWETSRKVPVIKQMRGLLGTDLKETKGLVESLMGNTGPGTSFEVDLEDEKLQACFEALKEDGLKYAINTGLLGDLRVLINKSLDKKDYPLAKDLIDVMAKHAPAD